MHLSARLNVFLGVRNVSEEFVPQHMAVLKSFMRQKPMNLLFPLSVTGATVGSVLLFGAAAAAGSDHHLTAFSLLGALMTLALVEHWFLVVPLPVEKLWRWSLPHQEAGDRAAKLRNPPPPKFDYTVSKITLTP